MVGGIVSKFFSRRVMGVAAAAAAAVVLAGCGEDPDVEAMKSGLMQAGMTRQQAECYAETLAQKAEGEPYNYMAELLGKGLPEPKAAKRARLKYGEGGKFRLAVKETRKACLQTPKPAAAASKDSGKHK